LKLASRPALARRYPCDFTFYLGKSLSSIAGEYIDSLEERPVFPGEKSLRAMDAGSQDWVSHFNFGIARSIN
jgi:hypothetical protein